MVVWICVPNVEHTIWLEDVVLLAPPSEIAKEETFDDSPGERCRWCNVSERKCGPEGDCSEAIGQTAAEWY